MGFLPKRPSFRPGEQWEATAIFVNTSPFPFSYANDGCNDLHVWVQGPRTEADPSPEPDLLAGVWPLQPLTGPRYCPQVETTTVIAPGERVGVTVAWNGSLPGGGFAPPGEYAVRADFNPPPTAPDATWPTLGQTTVLVEESSAVPIVTIVPETDRFPAGRVINITVALNNTTDQPFHYEGPGSSQCQELQLWVEYRGLHLDVDGPGESPRGCFTMIVPVTLAPGGRMERSFAWDGGFWRADGTRGYLPAGTYLLRGDVPAPGPWQVQATHPLTVDIGPDGQGAHVVNPEDILGHVRLVAYGTLSAHSGTTVYLSPDTSAPGPPPVRCAVAGGDEPTQCEVRRNDPADEWFGKPPPEVPWAVVGTWPGSEGERSLSAFDAEGRIVAVWSGDMDPDWLVAME